MSASTNVSEIHLHGSAAHVHGAGDRRPTGHSVQFYSDDRFLIAPLSRAFASALNSGDAAVLLATEPHRRAVLEMLEQLGVDISGAIKQNRFIPLDASESLAKFMRKGRLDAQLFALVIGEVIRTAIAASSSGRVTAFGEMVALLWSDGKREAAVELEELWNDLGRTHSFQLRCAYPLSCFRNAEDSQLFLKICAAHSDVVPGESYTELGSDSERLRSVAELQQKAQALDFEKKQRDSLRKANQELEASAATQQKELRKLGDSEGALRQLSQRLIRVQDEERRRLGVQLHDSVAQYLATLKMGLDILRSDQAPTGAAAQQLVGDCARLLERSIRELRSLSYSLYPPMMEEAGLQTAISWYLETFAFTSGIRASVDFQSAVIRLPREVELTIFRVLQESLTNVQHHSGSATAVVRLHIAEAEVCLEVRDSGKGIAPEVLRASNGEPGKLGTGLRAMEERVRHLGGELRLVSTPQGTTLTARLPLSATSQHT